MKLLSIAKVPLGMMMPRAWIGLFRYTDGYSMVVRIPWRKHQSYIDMTGEMTECSIKVIGIFIRVKFSVWSDPA